MAVPQYIPREEIDLTRLVRRLDIALSDEPWDTSSVDTWIKAEKTLQKVKFARSLLRKVSVSDYGVSTQEDRDGIRAKLDRVEEFAKGVVERTEPKPTRPAPILPTLPQPKPSPPPTPQDQPPSKHTSSIPSQGDEHAPPPEDLLPADTSTNFPLPPPMTLIPPTLPTTSTSTTTAVAPRPLHSSNAIHQELSEQLAQMAVQLRRNATHFSETLAKDQAVVEEVQQKLERNFDVMQKERGRLRDHGGKSRSTSCMVMSMTVAVVVLFALMVILIRFTRVL